MALQGCRQGTEDQAKELLNEEGLISAEFFLQKDTTIYFWKIREVPGRGTIIINEGTVGSEIRGYEIFERDRKVLEKRAAELYAEKRAAGYRIYKPEDYSHIIIQLDSLWVDDQSEIDKYVVLEELINQNLLNTGNGRCTGSNFDTRISFYAVVVNPEKATQTILSMINDEILDISIVIAIEKGNDIKVIYPENFQGNFSLI